MMKQHNIINNINIMSYLEENYDNLNYLVPNNNRHDCLNDDSKIKDIEDFVRVLKKQLMKVNILT